MTPTPGAHGAVPASGVLRSRPDDFIVDEQMGFAPDGEGEHLWLQLCKVNWNTTDLALALARMAKLPLRAVGYSGLKDRQAVTTQWFSLHLPGREDPDLSALPDGVTLVSAARHRRKLNRGTHRANRFDLRLRQADGDVAAVAERAALIRAQGVPNYFGVQRFGRYGDNAERATAWLLGEGEAPRKQALRSLWLSAVRSDLFNQVLAERVRQDNWQRWLPGDILQLDGRSALFQGDDDPQVAARVAAGEVHPTAPLPGDGGMSSSGLCAALEASVLAPSSAVIAALASHQVSAARRATRLPVADLQVDWEADQVLRVQMSLPAGAFATTVLAELVALRQMDNHGE
ncbi:tRNA pseudouridine(13) synthase TruD [Isoalcanivorax beigongshangi]|uniref:tRNA pseudouridine synthase D n=1 Tax=Isoalcanivorax beigongshangi TaxID=3238810 RepID=A0ABV4AHJ1_9GAMM